MYEVLRRFLPEARLLTNESMAKHTSFKIGGPADIYARPASSDELVKIIQTCRQHEAPFTLLGGGTNVLVADEGIRGVVIQAKPGMNKKRVYDGERITAEAGLSLADLAETACRAGLAGLSFASGIPGTVGGAVYMNAGAYDHDISEICETADILTAEGDVITLWTKDLSFAYRYSVLQKNDGIVLSATFKLRPGEPDAIRAETRELNARRATSQPLDLPSAGSTFKRPEGYYTGKLITDCGLKGFKIGGAQVSEKHAGFIVNTGEATCNDVKKLIQHVQQTVLSQYKVTLEPEIRFIG